jgi:hypothetical protein
VGVDGVIHKRPADPRSIQGGNSREKKTPLDSGPAEQRPPVEGQTEVCLRLQEVQERRVSFPLSSPDEGRPLPRRPLWISTH